MSSYGALAARMPLQRRLAQVLSLTHVCLCVCACVFVCVCAPCRYLKRIQNKSGDYAMLPTNDAADSDTNRTGTGSPAPTANTNKGLFTFWK